MSFRGRGFIFALKPTREPAAWLGQGESATEGMSFVWHTSALISFSQREDAPPEMSGLPLLSSTKVLF